MLLTYPIARMRIKTSLTPYLFLAPALLVLLFTVFWPALQAFRLSFMEYGYTVTQPPTWVGLDNFERLLKDKTFWQTLKNTVVYLVCVVPVLAIAPLLLAILVNQKLKGIRWFRVAYYTPVVVSMVVAGIAWKWLYAENGLLNQLISNVAGKEIAFPWLTDPNWVLFSVMAVTVWKGLGYYMVIYLAGLQGLPADLYEAAAIDGSDGWRKHWDITLPLMKRSSFVVSVIGAIAYDEITSDYRQIQCASPDASDKPVEKPRFVSGRFYCSEDSVELD